jgi:hypothetical protein
LQDDIVNGVPKIGSELLDRQIHLQNWQNSRQVHVWRTVYERYSSSCVVPNFKSGSTSLMIWAGFARDKKSKLVFMPKDRISL